MGTRYETKDGRIEFKEAAFYDPPKPHSDDPRQVRIAPSFVHDSYYSDFGPSAALRDLRHLREGYEALSGLGVHQLTGSRRQEQVTEPDPGAFVDNGTPTIEAVAAPENHLPGHVEVQMQPAYQEKRTARKLPKRLARLASEWHRRHGWVHPPPSQPPTGIGS